MEIRIELEQHADLQYIKGILSQLKGVKKFKVSTDDEAKHFVWNDVENSEAFRKVIERSRNQIENGEFVEHSKELLEAIFNKK